MLRGIVYSFIAICLFLTGCILTMLWGGISDESTNIASGWLLLIGFFGVGPVGFGLGYWHHRIRHPRDPHWDPELGE